MIDNILLDQGQSRITVTHVPNTAGIAGAIFEKIASKKILVDMIVQSFAHDQFADISFTVPRDQCETATAVAREFGKKFECRTVESKSDIAKLSVAGIGLQSHTGVALGTFQALSDAGINIEMINTSEVRVNVVIDSEHSDLGIQCLRQHFQTNSG